MSSLFAAEVWHYWLSFFIFGGVALAVIATLIGYLTKITANKYPKQ